MKKKILDKRIDQLKPVYLLYSEEKYLLDEFVDEFINKFIDDGIKDFNFNYIDDEEENFVNILKSQVNTLPVMADKRFIIVKSENFFKKKTSQDNQLIKLFNNFPDTTILLILIEGKIDKRLKIIKSIKKTGEVVEINPLKYKDLDDWIKIQFKSKGKKVDKTVIETLKKMFNNELQLLESEIEKIITFNYEKEFINVSDVLDIISKDRLINDEEIFSFTDALIGKEKGKALKILNEMIEDGAVPFMILGTIVWQLNLLLSVKELKKKGLNPDQIAKVIKKHPYPVKKSYRQSDNFTLEEIELLMEKFLKANYDIVTGKYNEKMALEMAILK